MKRNCLMHVHFQGNYMLNNSRHRLLATAATPPLNVGRSNRGIMLMESALMATVLAEDGGNVDGQPRARLVANQRRNRRGRGGKYIEEVSGGSDAAAGGNADVGANGSGGTQKTGGQKSDGAKGDAASGENANSGAGEGAASGSGGKDNGAGGGREGEAGGSAGGDKGDGAGGGGAGGDKGDGAGGDGEKSKKRRNRRRRRKGQRSEPEVQQEQEQGDCEETVGGKVPTATDTAAAETASKTTEDE